MIAVFTQTFLITWNSLSAGGFKFALNAFTLQRCRGVCIRGLLLSSADNTGTLSPAEKKDRSTQQQPTEADIAQSRAIHLSERGESIYGRFGVKLGKPIRRKRRYLAKKVSLQEGCSGTVCPQFGAYHIFWATVTVKFWCFPKKSML